MRNLIKQGIEMGKKIYFDNEQRNFIKFCLQSGASNKQITNDLCEMLEIPLDDEKARQRIYKRVQKTKERMPDDEIGSVPVENLSDTPQWRKTYLRHLLLRATDEKLKAKILSDMRSEDRLIAKSKRQAGPDEDKEEKERLQAYLYKEGDWPAIDNLPEFNSLDWTNWIMAGGPMPIDCHDNTFLPLDEYDYIELPKYNSRGYYVRKSDGKKVWKDGLPLTPAEENSGERLEEWLMKGPDRRGIFPRWTIARNAYLRNYYLKRGLEPPLDDVFDTDIYNSSMNRPAGWWHEQRKIKTQSEQLRAAKKYRRNS